MLPLCLYPILNIMQYEFILQEMVIVKQKQGNNKDRVSSTGFVLDNCQV